LFLFQKHPLLQLLRHLIVFKLQFYGGIYVEQFLQYVEYQSRGKDSHTLALFNLLHPFGFLWRNMIPFYGTRPSDRIPLDQFMM